MLIEINNRQIGIFSFNFKGPELFFIKIDSNKYIFILMYFNNNHYIEICKNIFPNKILNLSEYKQIKIDIKYFQEIS